jgi:hypothetical protein
MLDCLFTPSRQLLAARRSDTGWVADDIGRTRVDIIGCDWE